MYTYSSSCMCVIERDLCYLAAVYSFFKLKLPHSIIKYRKLNASYSKSTQTTPTTSQLSINVFNLEWKRQACQRGIGLENTIEIIWNGIH